MERSANVLYNLSGLLSLFNSYFFLAKINHIPLTLTEATHATQIVTGGEVMCGGGGMVCRQKCNGTVHLSYTLSQNTCFVSEPFPSTDFSRYYAEDITHNIACFNKSHADAG